ncbi:MAG: peptide deformylase, peptide deformylase [Candidatus Taylorbacteria bacterium]|nr:peptide deformylase, peptide deformylase [Candidatus Taylorbacteria bacterium]
MVAIVQNGHKTLREKAKEVPIHEIESKKIQKVILDMKKALLSQDDGVAIAAPQIGESLRIFVVSGRAFDIGTGDYEENKSIPIADDIVFINPVITKLSRDKEEMDEGCLSVRYLYGKVKRSKKASIEAYDENGKKFKRGASGLLAQIFQHETDHLDAVLFIDKAKDIVNLPPKND